MRRFPLDGRISQSAYWSQIARASLDDEALARDLDGVGRDFIGYALFCGLRLDADEIEALFRHFCKFFAGRND